MVVTRGSSSGDCMFILFLLCLLCFTLSWPLLVVDHFCFCFAALLVHVQNDDHDHDDDNYSNMSMAISGRLTHSCCTPVSKTVR